jgi:hypothetical protein
MSSRLAGLLHTRGFPGADFERLFTVTDSVTGKHVPRKPDVVVPNGGTHIVSAKDGERLEREAIATAIMYIRDLSPVTTLGEVFALTYAKKGESFHLHVLPSGSRQEVSLVLDTLEEVADAIAETIHGRLAELAQEQEPIQDEAKRLLRYAAMDLADLLEGVPEVELEEIFGGHDFFHAALETLLSKEERNEALKLGPAYLFVNQVFFYILLSEAAKAAGDEKLYPVISQEDRSSPSRLHDEYFSRVRRKDYEPIYGPNVARFLDQAKAGRAVEHLVDTVMQLSPKLTVPDIVGQIFQGLIPLSIRKPLGAHYTNPNAAALLARLAVEDSNWKVMDLACGSGTLLVAAYRRKMELARSPKVSSLHKRFVEEDITGLDVMAFSCHLAAVNLALQQPLLDTDHVRIGRRDSTLLHPGEDVVPASEALPREFKQFRLEDDFTKESRPSSRVPSLREGGSGTFRLSRVNLVIMNPPFTSQNNLSKDYREALKYRFASYSKLLFWKTSQQTYFLLLADRFLEPDGKIAAVLPLTTFTGVAFRPLIRHLVRNYTIETIIIGLGRSSFSEDTSLTECLFIAKKTPVGKNHRFTLVGLNSRPENWKKEDIDNTYGIITSGKQMPELGVVRKINQDELLPEKQALSTLFLRLDPAYDQAWRVLQDTYSRSNIRLVKIKDLFNRGLEITEVYHGKYRLLGVGPKAIAACRTEERAMKNTDRLILSKESRDHIELVDKINPGKKYLSKRSSFSSFIRRFSYLRTMDVSHDTDFIANEITPELEQTMNAFYPKGEAKRHLSDIRRAGWRGIITHGSARVNISARANLAAPGTMLLAYRSETPAFLGGYGYNVRGFGSIREEKLFILWFNSSMALVELLAKATITEGSWVKLEQFTTEQLTFPDPARLTEAQWKSIEDCWDLYSREQVPSLLEQLRKGNSIREEVDVILLQILGADKTTARSVSRELGNGVLAAIDLLRKTMGKGPDEEAYSE